MIVDVKLVESPLRNKKSFEAQLMGSVKDFQRLGYRVEIQYSADCTALVIARECNWVGNNS